MLQRPQARAAVGERDTDWEELDWDELVADAEPADCVEVEATDPLYVLYTSGTTGRPKGIVRDNGGHAVALRWSMENVYDIGPGDVWFTASDVGWVVGHSYIVYAPLLTGATTVLYEGKPVGTPDASAFWRVIGDHGVKAMFTAPTAYRAIKREDAAGSLMAGHDLSTLRCVFLAGERLDPDTYEWATGVLGVPVVDNWWQTETGWPIAANLRGLDPMPIKAGSPSVRVPGYDVQVLDDSAQPMPPGSEGAIAIRLPLPPGTLPTLWQDDERYVSSYLSVYDGYYLTGDGGMIDEDGYVYVMGRTDDVLNVAGHRLSTGSIEAALAGHPDVAECAVIGVADDLKGQVPRGLVVLKGGVDGTGVEGERICAELVQRVRDEVGAVASLRRVDIVAGAAQDPLGQDPAQDDARDGRRQDPDDPRHHRGRLGARRPRVGAAARAALQTAPSGAGVARVVARGALVAAAVVARHPRHQLLRVLPLDVDEEVRGPPAPQHGRPAAVVGDDHLGAAQGVVESFGSWHAPRLGGHAGRRFRRPGGQTGADAGWPASAADHPVAVLTRRDPDQGGEVAGEVRLVVPPVAHGEVGERALPPGVEVGHGIVHPVAREHPLRRHPDVVREPPLEGAHRHAVPLGDLGHRQQRVVGEHVGDDVEHLVVVRVGGTVAEGGQPALGGLGPRRAGCRELGVGERPSPRRRAAPRTPRPTGRSTRRPAGR